MTDIILCSKHFPRFFSIITCYFSTAEEACIGNTGSISNGGCNGLRACYENEGDIGEGACSSLEKTIEDVINLDDYPGACMYNWATIGSSSCRLIGACYGSSYDMEMPIPIGSDSWYVFHSLRLFTLFKLIFSSRYLSLSFRLKHWKLCMLS